ncbi:DUF4157 domain-containing protein [Blastococcus sp. CT_GayMR19]|uniref:eCIS core domain-containing protein n=1 Tax=Blastococcus sp. CT_GayMR19 TaxID=2559608 RepID=UPI0010739093|nr:DUF4157 domain-containing protein [Blastococcus sp. CT_GayMR19]TFV77497.1 DUF4157 domain-containing protein [Blastococcus sp. CT_GayMR19]
MPEYRHDQDRDEQVHATQRLRADGRPSPQAMLAAASGRTDVLSGSTVLALQRTAGNAGVGAMLEEERSPVHDVVGSGGGSPLPTDVRTDMETRLGADFGDVRVHTDDKAHDSARAVHAQAYTVGSDVVFQRGGYDPSSTAGRTTLAHELTHVVQQRSGPVDGTPAAGGIRVSDPSDRFEREASANAERAMSDTAEAPAPVSASPIGVQRQEEGEEEEESPPA